MEPTTKYNATVLTAYKWIELYKLYQQKKDERFKFQLPGLDTELDIRDYFLVSVPDTTDHVLVRRPDQKEWITTDPFEPLKFPPASLIALDGATEETVKQLTELFPELLERFHKGEPWKTTNTPKPK